MVLCIYICIVLRRATRRSSQLIFDLRLFFRSSSVIQTTTTNEWNQRHRDAVLLDYVRWVSHQRQGLQNETGIGLIKSGCMN